MTKPTLRPIERPSREEMDRWWVHPQQPEQPGDSPMTVIRYHIPPVRYGSRMLGGRNIEMHIPRDESLSVTWWQVLEDRSVAERPSL